MTEQKTPDITLYTYETTNGQKVSIVLEELGIPYKVQRISLENAEQKEPWYLKISPVGQIPAITDHSRGDFNVFESGAIILYLCEHYDPEGKLLPKDPDLRSQVIQWIMFQMADLGPRQAQANFFVRYSPIEFPFGIKQFPEFTKRHYATLDHALEGKDYLVGNTYTLADVINYTSVRAHSFAGVPSIDDLTNLKAWVARIDARPATQRGLNVPAPDMYLQPKKLEEFANMVKEKFCKFLEQEKKMRTFLI